MADAKIADSPAERGPERPERTDRSADETRAKLEARLQLECAVSSQTVKVVRLWGDFYRANYWAQVPTARLLLATGTPVVATSRFIRAKATPAGIDIHDLTANRPSPTKS